MPSPAAWSLQHPENWDPASVEEWINHVALKYNFPDDIRRKCVSRLRGVSGKRLVAMQMADFQYSFKEVGELIYMAFLQILDVGPDFKERSQYYTERIRSILEVLKQSNKVINPPLWKTLPVTQWTSTEVTQWLTSVMEDNSSLQNDSDRLFEAFEGINGQQLSSMSDDEVSLLAKDHMIAIKASLSLLKKKDTDEHLCLSNEQTRRPHDFEGPDSFEYKSQPHSW